MKSTLNSRTRLEPDAFLRAAELMDDDICGDIQFACHAIQHVVDQSTGSSSPERQFFEQIFGCGYDKGTFEVLDCALNYPERASYIELQNIRVLALCFAAERARLRNNKK